MSTPATTEKKRKRHCHFEHGAEGSTKKRKEGHGSNGITPSKGKTNTSTNTSVTDLKTLGQEKSSSSKDPIRLSQIARDTNERNGTTSKKSKKPSERTNEATTSTTKRSKNRVNEPTSSENANTTSGAPDSIRRDLFEDHSTSNASLKVTKITVDDEHAPIIGQRQLMACL